MGLYFFADGVVWMYGSVTFALFAGTETSQAPIIIDDELVSFEVC